MFSHVAPVRACLSTYGAAVGLFAFLHYVLIELPSVPSCKQQGNLEQNLKLVFVHPTYVVVQLVTTGEGL